MIPTITVLGSRSLKNSQPSTATQTGSMAIRKAAMPAGTVRSPTATRPIPPPSSRPPTIAESRH